MNKKILVFLNKISHGYANKIIPMRLRNKKNIKPWRNKLTQELVHRNITIETTKKMEQKNCNFCRFFAKKEKIPKLTLCQKSDIFDQLTKMSHEVIKYFTKPSENWSTDRRDRAEFSFDGIRLKYEPLGLRPRPR